MPDSNAPLIVIFGITGDLSKRKLLPALYHMFKLETLSDSTKIIGTSRRPLEKDKLIDTVELCVLDKDKICDPKIIQKIYKSLETLQLDPAKPGDYKNLRALLEKIDPSHKRMWLFYFSVPSTAYSQLAGNLAETGLNQDNCRLLLEKPFGHDYNSAEKLIQSINKDFKEGQVYRIDHYLAKDTAQNLLAFRLHNPIFSPLWNNQHIERVSIKAFETIGIEGRDNFYEQTGALRDFIQSHLLQLLAITLMDVPSELNADAIHKAKLDFMQELYPANAHQAVRGQYSGYREEVSNPRSFTETYAKIKLNVASNKWHDVEIKLETGKAMNEKTTVVVVEFKTVHERRRNSLTFNIQPDEGINLDLVVKEPGLTNEMKHTELSFKYDEVFKNYLKIDAYEKVLLDACRGDQSLFASSAEVLETWRVLQPIIENWSLDGHGLVIYPVGSKEVKSV